MAIKKKPHQRSTSIRASSTYFPSLDSSPDMLLDVPEGDLDNHQTPNILHDPDDVSPMDTYTKIGAHLKKTTASRRKLRSAVDDDLPNDSSNVSTLGNEVDPLDGYDLEDASGVVNLAASKSRIKSNLLDDDDEGFDVGEGYELGDESTEELDSPGAPAGLLEGDNDEEGWDDDSIEDESWDPESDPADLVEEESDEGEAVNLDVDTDDLDDDEVSGSHGEEGGEILDIVDVDEIPEDDDGQLLAYALSGSNLLVMRKNRVIASLSKKQAELRSTADIYTTDQFQDATSSEVRRHGLRAGLKNMGFVLAKINIAKSSVVNKRVNAKVEKLTASVRRNNSDYDKVMAQSLAIASVGINRALFKDVPNPLKAHLEDQMRLAGIQGGQRMVRAAFAKYGVEYAKSVVTLAQKLAAQPNEARKMYAEALDMTDDEGVFEDIADDVETDATVTDLEFNDPSVDFVDAAEDSFDNLEDQDIEEDVFASNRSITAALSRPGIQSRSKQSSNAHLNGSISISASAVLHGESPLF